MGAEVSPGYFEMLGVSPALGRAFAAEEERDGGADVIVLSDGFWRSHFGADRACSVARCRSMGVRTRSSASCRRASIHRSLRGLSIRHSGAPSVRPTTIAGGDGFCSSLGA